MDAIIGIIGAMDVEVQTIIAQLESDQKSVVSGMAFHQGSLGGRTVVVVRCGVGKVNAAMCAQTLVERFGATHVINTGVAGSLSPELHVGDLVVSTDAVQHDVDVTGLGYAPGVLFGMESVGFAADAWLREAVCRAVAEVTPDINVRCGRVASGDQFVSSQEVKERIVSTFGALCCEMEGAAIAQVCARNEVPFVIVRTISDNADESSKSSYRLSEKEEAEHCAAIVARTIALLG